VRLHYTLIRANKNTTAGLNVILLLISMYLSSGLFHTLSERIREKVRPVKKAKYPDMGGAKHSQVWFALCVMALVIMSLFLTSCVALIYDAVQGGQKSSGETHTLTVDYNYSGSRTISSTTPMYIASFGYYFTGDDPDLVYMSDPLTRYSGSWVFSALEEMSYGVIAFIDENDNCEPDFGEVYQFYNGKDYEPDEIFLNSTQTVTVSLTDDYEWFDAFFEDFEDGSMSEKWFDDGSGRWTIFTGVSGSDYRMQYAGMADVAFSYYDAEYADFTLEVEAMQSSGDTSSPYGVFFRSVNPDDYGTTYFSGYELTVDSSGYWRLARWDSGVRTTLVPDTFSSNLSGFGKPNLLHVECYDFTISVSFNGTQESIITDGTHLSGRVGLTAAEHGSSNIFAFDDISVTR